MCHGTLARQLFVFDTLLLLQSQFAFLKRHVQLDFYDTHFCILPRCIIFVIFSDLLERATKRTPPALRLHRLDHKMSYSDLSHNCPLDSIHREEITSCRQRICQVWSWQTSSVPEVTVWHLSALWPQISGSLHISASSLLPSSLISHDAHAISPLF